MTQPPDITIDDIRAELTPHGRELLEQAIGSAQRRKMLEIELARVANATQAGPPPAGEPEPAAPVAP